jgi:hypothetical protein
MREVAAAHTTKLPGTMKMIPSQEFQTGFVEAEI